MTSPGVGRGRVPDGWSAGVDELGEVLRHDTVDAVLHRVPRGRYRIGMSDAEWTAAQRLDPIPNITLSEVRPVVEVEIAGDVFVGDRPITVRLAGALGVEVDGASPGQPAMLTRPEAETVVGRLGCRLPREAEWEVGCRAGSTGLFPWGDELPSDEDLGSWLAWELEDGPVRRNALGLGGLFFGEWCEEPFRVSHAPGAEVVDGTFVVKGGGAQFWPWQDQEWVWCAPAMRMPSSGLLADGRGAARPVLVL